MLNNFDLRRRHTSIQDNFEQSYEMALSRPPPLPVFVRSESGEDLFPVLPPIVSRAPPPLPTFNVVAPVEVLFPPPPLPAPVVAEPLIPPSPPVDLAALSEVPREWHRAEYSSEQWVNGSQELSSEDYAKSYGYHDGGFLPYFKLPGEPLLLRPVDDRLTREQIEEMSTLVLKKRMIEFGIVGDLSREEMIEKMWEYQQSGTRITSTEFADEVYRMMKRITDPEVSRTNFPLETRFTARFMEALLTRVDAGAPYDAIVVVGEVKPFAELFEEELEANSKYPSIYHVMDTLSNRKTVKKFFKAFDIIRDRNANKIVVKAPKRSYGIIGLETPFVEPQWLRDAVPGTWDESANPRRGSKGIITFTRCSFSREHVNRALVKANNIRVGASWPFYRISLKMYSIGASTSDLAYDDMANYIMRMQKPISIVGWDTHAMIVHRIGTVTYLYDPWKQDHHERKSFQEIRRRMNDRGFEFKFVKRDAEQSNEGSCMWVAFARALALSAGVPPNLPIPDEIIVLAHRLLIKSNEEFV